MSGGYIPRRQEVPQSLAHRYFTKIISRWSGSHLGPLTADLVENEFPLPPSLGRNYICIITMVRQLPLPWLFGGRVGGTRSSLAQAMLKGKGIQELEKEK